MPLVRPKVLVGVACGTIPRSTEFWSSVTTLETPDHQLHLVRAMGKSPAENRNEIIRQAQAMNAERIFFVDDDMELCRDTLMRLYEHDEDIVSGLYPLGWPPFFPAVFREQSEDGTVQSYELKPEDKGLQEVKAVGAGSLLCKTEIFDHPNWEDPWWKLGQIKKDGWCDDTFFCLEARRNGFKVFCDFDTPVMHPPQGLRMNFARLISGEWMVRFSTLTQELFAVPIWKAPILAA